MVYISKVLFHIFLMYCFLSFLKFIDFLFFDFLVDLKLYFMFDQIRQDDMFCSFLVFFLYITSILSTKTSISGSSGTFLSLTLIRLGFLRAVFLGGRGWRQVSLTTPPPLSSPFIFQKELI